MKMIGLLNPITVVQTKDGYEILAGCRRFAAALNLHWKTIRATVFPPIDTPKELCQIHENLIREQVSPTDEARWIKATMLEHHWNARQISSKIGRVESWVSDRLALLSLPNELTDKLDAGEIPFSAARELGRVKDPAKRAALIAYAVKGGVDTPTAESWRRDADSGNCIIDPAAQPLPPGERPSPARMLCRCEVCDGPHDITVSKVLKVCAKCYDAIFKSGT
jgi:ParB family chromosome partitioning protein